MARNNGVKAAKWMDKFFFLKFSLIYKNGKEVWRESGEMDGQALLSKIESYM